MRWFLNRFKYAFAGLAYAARHDRSIRLQMLAGICVVAAALFLGCTIAEWLWLLLAITLVIAGEFLNSCIEKTVDYISLERHPLAGTIKDMAACAVLILSFFAAVCGILILGPRLLALFG